MAKHNARGRSKNGLPFVLLHHWVMNSEAYNALMPAERCVLHEIYKLYNGSNNGFIFVSNKQLGERTNTSPNTACRSIQRLEKLGFIEIVVRGSFSQKVRRATEYRLTEHKCDKTNHLAKKTFMRWPVEKK